MLIFCGYCNTKLLNYQKLGKGGLMRLYIERVIGGEIDFSKNQKLLVCPKCGETLAIRTKLKRENKEVYSMIRGSFNSKKLY